MLRLLGSVSVLLRYRGQHLHIPSVVYASHSPVGSVSATGGSKGPKLIRGQPGKVRLGFLPEEWFLFMNQKTGVSGPYVLALVFANYVVSKEVFVMEHEYYSGLSWFVIIVGVYKKFGEDIAKILDKEVDAVYNEWEMSRKTEVDHFNALIKSAKDAQWRAEGQKLLMDAKKENIKMQIEAIYRERSMQVYHAVKGRMDYHVKRYQTEARIQQKWMIGWILQNVMNSITPEFQKQALDRAITDLGALASRPK